MPKHDEQADKKRDFQLSLKSFTAFLLIPFIVAITLGNFIIFEKMFSIKQVSDTTIDSLVHNALTNQKIARDIDKIRRYTAIAFFTQEKEQREKALATITEIIESIKASQTNKNQKKIDETIILLNKLDNYIEQSENISEKFHKGCSNFFYKIIEESDLELYFGQKNPEARELFAKLRNIENPKVITQINSLLNEYEQNIDNNSDQAKDIVFIKDMQTQLAELLLAQNEYNFSQEQAQKINTQLDILLEEISLRLVDSSIKNIEDSFSNITIMLKDAHYSNIFIFTIIILFSITFIFISKHFIFNNIRHIFTRLEMLKNENYQIDQNKFFIKELSTINNILNDFGQELEIFHQNNQKLNQEKQQLEKLSTYDSLTGAFNRRYMDTCLENSLKSLSRNKSSLSLLMMDIDNFKNYNDTLGHVQGDKCLQMITNCIKNSLLRPSDLLFRYGGEEFVIILPNTCAEDAIIVAKRILKNIQKEHIPHPSSFVDYVTISIGIASTSYKELTTNSDIIIKADQALYIAKKTGQNRYQHIDFN